MKKYILPWIALLITAACTPKSDSLEGIAGEVLKHKEGLDIQFKPLQEDKGLDVVNKKF